MYIDIVDRLKTAQDRLCEWLQPFILADGTDLSSAVGPNGTPPHVPYRPRCFPVDQHLRPLSHFMFDPKLFHGPEAVEPLGDLIKTCCPGTTWVFQNKEIHVDKVVYRLKCSHYKINYNLQKSVFHPEKCTRPNVAPAREQKSKSKSQYSFLKMGKTGLQSNKSKKRKHQPASLHKMTHTPHRQIAARIPRWRILLIIDVWLRLLCLCASTQKIGISVPLLISITNSTRLKSLLPYLLKMICWTIKKISQLPHRTWSFSIHYISDHDKGCQRHWPFWQICT